jgi:hypothetical protein
LKYLLKVLGASFIQFSTIENINNQNTNINTNNTRKFYINNQENGADSTTHDDSNKKPINLLTSYLKTFIDTSGTQK